MHIGYICFESNSSVMHKFLILLIALSGILAVSCDKYEEEEYYGYLKVNGVEYPVEGTFVYDYGTDLEAVPPYRIYEINLTSDMLDSDAETSIFFYLNSPSTTNLAWGTYQYSSSPNEYTDASDLYDIQVEYDFEYDQYGVATQGKILYNDDVVENRSNKVYVKTYEEALEFKAEFNCIKNGEDYNVLVYYYGPVESEHGFSRSQ